MFDFNMHKVEMQLKVRMQVQALVIWIVMNYI